MLPPSAKPYMVRAIYDWCLAEGHTPYLLASINPPGVRVPEGHAKDGRITLNINPRAVDGLQLGTDRVSFSARFGANPFEVLVPYDAVVAIFSAETHEGMVFGDPHPSMAEPAVALPPKATPDSPMEAAPAAATQSDEKSDKPADGDEPPRLRLVE